MAITHDVSSHARRLVRGHCQGAAGLRRGWTVLALWGLRARSRRELGRLDDRLLADIGIGPMEARREARKPFWRA